MCLPNNSTLTILNKLLKYKPQIVNLLSLLVDKAKGERGYTSTGRLISRVLHTVAGVYPLNSRFVNTNEWEDPGASLFLLMHSFS